MGQSTKTTVCAADAQKQSMRVIDELLLLLVLPHIQLAALEISAVGAFNGEGSSFL